MKTMLIGTFLLLPVIGNVRAACCGYTPFPPKERPDKLRIFAVEKDTLPPAFDWREELPGSVTPARDQHAGGGTCGSCWAFAAIACVESHLVIHAGLDLDLSEQYAVSCDESNEGCCGGDASVYDFFETGGFALESCFPYVDGIFDCPANHEPPYSTAPCLRDCPQPEGFSYDGWYAVAGEMPSQVKAAIMEGPVSGGFLLHEDFIDYWNWQSEATDRWPDGVYEPTSPSTLGGHSVVAFGWDDALGCWLCKNSWGAGGPFGDGTFRLRYRTCFFPAACRSVHIRPTARFRRGAVDPRNPAVTIATAVYLLQYIFLGLEAPSCLDAADINDSGTIDIADPISLLTYLFAGAPAPPVPFTACGPDPTPDSLTCESPVGCPLGLRSISAYGGG